MQALSLLAINLNHRTRPAEASPQLVNALIDLQPDVLVFNEYVDQVPATAIKSQLRQVGFQHQAVSASVEYMPGRWHNQVLIAARQPLTDPSSPRAVPDSNVATNTLSVTTAGSRITGVRVPAYKTAADCYNYWEWANTGLDGDVLIGDFNADPNRARKRDRVLGLLEQAGGWRRPSIDGEWSYKGNNGSTSCVDHVLVRNHVDVVSASYVADSFVPAFTDHAALLAVIGKQKD